MPDFVGFPLSRAKSKLVFNFAVQLDDSVLNLIWNPAFALQKYKYNLQSIYWKTHISPSLTQFFNSLMSAFTNIHFLNSYFLIKVITGAEIAFLFHIYPLSLPPLLSPSFHLFLFLLFSFLSLSGYIK